jgi:hypothetical protein
VVVALPNYLACRKAHGMSRRKLLQRLILIVFGIGIGCFLALAAFSKKPLTQQSIPPVQSQIPTIEIVRTKIINEGELRD